MARSGTDGVLAKLKRGNARFVEGVKGGTAAELNRDPRPHAIVLGCADSRVSPEIVFDAGLGELFVVRVAGNVANTASIASIEFAVAHLGSRLVVVLAHESCRAVGAALEDRDLGKNLNHLLGHIAEAVKASGAGDADAVARRNARLAAERLTTESEILRQAVSDDGLRIVTAFFHLSTGAIEFE